MGHPLKKARTDANLTQDALAELAGISTRTIATAESGKPVGPDARRKLCNYFHKSSEELGLLNKEVQSSKHAVKNLPSPLQTSYKILAEYIQQQLLRILGAVTPGSAKLRVEDVIGEDGLLIPPPWQVLQGGIPDTENLTAYLVEAALAGQKVLLLGEAGQGKTTVLKHIFVTLANDFLRGNQPIAYLPLYIPLRDFSYLEGSTAEVLWTQIQEHFPLPFADFGVLLKNNQILFLFDGFDELKGELTQSSINDLSSNKIFSRPSILTCRKSFFDFYLSMSPLQELYPQCIELKPLIWDDTVAQYIKTFCQQKGFPHRNSFIHEKILQTIQTSPELQDLAQRPMLLSMMLDIFTDNQDIEEVNWNISNLYKKYTEKWLKNEASKPHSVLKWNEKARILEEVAWTTYRTKSPFSSPYGNLNQNVIFTYEDIAAIVKCATAKYHIAEAHILDDVCFRTLLIISEGESYHFLHKSFQEYYAACYLLSCMKSQDANAVERIKDALQILIPADIGVFLKQIKRETSLSEKGIMTDNLIRVYQSSNGDDERAVTIRQQSSHYIAHLGTHKAAQFLLEIYEQESNKRTQRGIMVGLALYCGKIDILNQYIELIRQDPEVASINIGFHLVYYGDQPQELGFYDRGGEGCDRTIAAIIRRLKEDRYKNSWALDILTLSMLLESRGTKKLLSKSWYLPFLQQFLHQDHSKLSVSSQQEATRLKILLEGM